mgnify:FL=1
MVYGVCMLIRTQVLFSEELLFALRAEAAKKKTSVSQLVRHIVTDKMPEKNKKKMSGDEAMELMVKHAYKGKVPRDLSTNDDYLYKLP